MRRAVFISILLLLATLAAYWPLRFCGFINFDDPLYVTKNPHVFHGLSRDSLRWAFTAMHSANWHPLTWLSHMFDCQVFGDDPPAHHFVNLFFHGATTLLLFWTLKRMTNCEVRSALVAALFAVHPLHVESVAWIAERKDVLSALFFVLTIWAYARFAEENKVPSPESKVLSPLVFYIAALLFFALGLMSKPMLVTLPFVLLLLDFWPLRRNAEWRMQSAEPGERGVRNAPLRQGRGLRLAPLLVEKLPFFLLAAASSVVTVIAQSKGGAVVSEEMIPIRYRIVNAIVAYAAYLVKMVWPQNLAVFYPHPGEWPAWIVAGSLLLLGGVSFVVLRAGGGRPYLIVGWLWYLGTLVPVIGFVQVGSQTMADRYTYLPLVGIFMMIVWGAADLSSPWPRRKAALALAGGLTLSACVILSNHQVRYWRDSVTLFRHALKVTPENALAEGNLGRALSQSGQQEEAIVHLEKAIKLNPDFALGHMNLGDALNLNGRLDEAMAQYNEAIKLNPEYEAAHYELANALAVKGRLPEAETHFEAALRYKPDYAEAHTKLANLLALQGKHGEAMPHYLAAIKSNPDYEAGHYFLAVALARQKDFEKAAAALRRAIKLKSDDPLALNDLAWILATTENPKIRNIEAAISFAHRACEVTRRENPKYLDTLAVAYSEARRFPEAIETTRRAVAAAESAGQQKLAGIIQSRLSFYEQGRSYRESSRSGP